MEELGLGREPVGKALDDRTPVGWRDLRDWLELVEQAGELKRIAAPVDPDEELAAITFMAGRDGRAGAAVQQSGRQRDGLARPHQHAGPSKERYALAVGLDPDLSTAEMIAAIARPS